MPASPRRDPPPFDRLVALELDPNAELDSVSPHDGFPDAPTSDGARITCIHEPAENAHDAFGIALSGGGIRSATFNLGLLQGLSALDLLDEFDYLATVSGGGYVGGFLSAARAGLRSQHRNRTRHILLPPDADPRADGVWPGVESPAVRHLREYGNFLAPRLGLFSYDTGRMIVAALSAAIPSLAASLSLIGLVLAAWLVLAATLLGAPPSFLDWLSPVALAAALTAGVFIVAEFTWQRRGERWSWWYALASAATVAVVAFLWSSAMRAGWWTTNELYDTAPPLPLIGENARVAGWLMLLLPAGIWTAAAVLLMLGRWFSSRFRKDVWWRAPCAAFDRTTSRLLFMTGVWSVIAVVWIGGIALWQWFASAVPSEGARFTGLAGTTAALAVVFNAIQRVLSRTTGVHHLGGRVRAWLLPKLPQVAAYATILGMVLMVIALIAWLAVPDAQSAAASDGTLTPLGIALIAAVLVTVITLALFDPNEIGLHAFYRARIARAFLGAWNEKGRRETEERSDDDLPLDRLRRERPLHLVCCAANDLSSDDHLGNLHRGAASAVLSPVGFSVGSDWTPWMKDRPVPTLASAVTASGAAFNSHMGSLSMSFGPAVTFVMAALNLRLGLWQMHPTAMRGPWHYRAFPGVQFYLELFGLSRVNGRFVHLSDGGHFENMALYELVRRHCRYIIASDCGADEDVSFDDFGNLVRRVREDFGVEIEIDLSPLKPSKDTGLAAQPMVAGDIHYPNGDTGVLLLFKPTLIGTEPADIAQYRRRNAVFPHESTGDQFYDEAQWESYRRLGFYAANVAFGNVVTRCGKKPKVGVRTWAARIFARARMRWLPVPEGLESRLARHVDRAAALDGLLQQTGCRIVLREVYREMRLFERMAAGERPPSLEGNGSAGDSDNDNASGALTVPSLADSLHAIRRAILFMEEVFYAERLGRNYNHPVYLGLLNYFARWVHAPLFRMWWPVLKALYTERFTAFMEERFGLAAIPPREPQNSELDAKIVTDLAQTPDGFAMHCWQLRENRAPRPDETVISYHLRVVYESAEYQVQAGVIVGQVLGDLFVWDSNNFFVPPGLWGIGIGEDFLDRLVAGRGAVFESGPLRGASHLVVSVARPKRGHAAKKESADIAQLYRAAGFSEVKVKSGATSEYSCDISTLELEMRRRKRWFGREIGVSEDERRLELFDSGTMPVIAGKEGALQVPDPIRTPRR
jgi:hypothetical protein